MEIVEKALESPNCPNLILYGDRYSQIYESLCSLVDKEHHLRDLKITDSSFGYCHTHYYHELDISVESSVLTFPPY